MSYLANINWIAISPVRHQVRRSAPGNITLKQAARYVQAGRTRSGASLWPEASPVLGTCAGHEARPFQAWMGAPDARQPPARPIDRGRVVFRVRPRITNQNISDRRRTTISWIIRQIFTHRVAAIQVSTVRSENELETNKTLQRINTDTVQKRSYGRTKKIADNGTKD